MKDHDSLQEMKQPGDSAASMAFSSGSICFRSFTRGIQLRPGQFGRLRLSVCPTMDRGLADTQLPGQVLLAD
jgi:hypothetical protein